MGGAIVEDVDAEEAHEMSMKEKGQSSRKRSLTKSSVSGVALACQDLQAPRYSEAARLFPKHQRVAIKYSFFHLLGNRSRLGDSSGALQARQVHSAPRKYDCQEMSSKSPTREGSDHEDDADDILAELEAEDDNSYRAQRIQELKSEAKESQSISARSGQTIFKTLNGDDECLQFTTEHDRSLVHFFHPDFARCSIMDQHCEDIAAKHTGHGDADVAFGRIDVRKAPFVIEKLSIKVLPALLGFVKGIVKGRVTGFEGVSWGGKEEGPAVTSILEDKLVEWTVLKKKLLDEVDEDEEDEKPDKSEYQRRGIQDRKQGVADEDDDWD